LIEDGGHIQQATVLFNAVTGETRSMRSKEDAHDYRYFPDPDLPPLSIGPEWIARVRAGMPELPHAMSERFQQKYGLSADIAAALTQSKAFAAYFEVAAQTSAQPKLAANWLMGEVSRRLNQQDMDIESCSLSATQLASMLARIADGSLSNNAARQVFDALWAEPNREVDSLIDSMGLRQVDSTDELVRIVDVVLADNEKSIAEFRAGKDKALNALVGQVMKASRGKADPARISELLRARLA